MSGLAVYGTLTKSPVATSADLMAYSGFSATNYLEQPYNTDLDFGTGDFCIMGWVNFAASTSTNVLFHRALAGSTGGLLVKTSATNAVEVYTSANTIWNSVISVGVVPVGGWHLVTVTRALGTLFVYVDGVLVGSVANVVDVSYPNAVARIGQRIDAGAATWGGSMSLFRIGATAPSADQIRHIYETEKVLFQDNAKCTLYGTSDAVTDMAYDEITESLNVLTSSGLSRFNGLRRVSEQAGTFAKVASHAGTEILI